MERKDFYVEVLRNNAEKLAEMLDAGKTIEIMRSRSGLKCYISGRKQHLSMNNTTAETTPNRK